MNDQEAIERISKLFCQFCPYHCPLFNDEEEECGISQDFAKALLKEGYVRLPEGGLPVLTDEEAFKVYCELACEFKSDRPCSDEELRSACRKYRFHLAQYRPFLLAQRDADMKVLRGEK